MNFTFVPDPCQQEVIEAEGGNHLVLASPGCGKTQILAERICRAHENGVDYADMLCLTFTNRAARGMTERIARRMGDEVTGEIFVGNVHRYCSRFLFANGLVPTESAVIDDDDAVSILARYLGDDEYSVVANYQRRREYAEVFHLSTFMHQIRMKHPKAIRVHSECLDSNDIAAMKCICRLQKKDFTPEMMVDMYLHADLYRSLTRSDTMDYGSQQIVKKMLRKMVLAWEYERYKRENRLLDFNDLLMFTYDALASDTTDAPRFHRYRWIQVDEVQDLNPLQMQIIRLLTAPDALTVMCLGDEQQAIFSFMGAKMGTLEALRNREGCCLHHLSVNHRSPEYLLQVFNDYAATVLGIDKAMLPQPCGDNHAVRLGNELMILRSDNYESEVRDVVQFAVQLNHNFPHDTTAIVVNANRDAEDIAAELKRCGVGFFKVSGTDLFATPDVKLVFAHLSVLNNEMNFMAWARLLHGLRVFEGSASARSFVRELFDRALMPSDLLRIDGGSYMRDFVECYEEKDIVVFDTETTGLDVFADDIVQIAAVKMRKGRVVPDSAFVAHLTTSREIPALLGDIVNPIIEERKHHTLIANDEALRQFMNYAEGAVLLAHNADYDYRILENNLRRYCPDISLEMQHPHYLDSLRLVRLLHPELKEHKLKYLLGVFGLEGENSHLADDDVNATCGVVAHCYEAAKERLAEQQRFLSLEQTRRHASALNNAYGAFYAEAIARKYVRRAADETPALVHELLLFRQYLLDDGKIQPIDGFEHITSYLASNMIDAAAEPSLYEQLSHHAMEIATLKEADLCGGTAMNERIFVTTIHKAKGLEFDNVILFDAVEGRMPNYYTRNTPHLFAEDARKFYVAITRAKRRLYVSQSLTQVGWHGDVSERHLTPFMRTVEKYFGSRTFAEE